MSILNKINDEMNTTESDETVDSSNLASNDSEETNNYDDELASSITSTKEEPDETSNDNGQAIHNPVDPVVDLIRESSQKVLVQVKTNQDINPSDKGKGLAKTIYDIYDTILTDCVRSVLINNATVNLNEIYSNDYSFEKSLGIKTAKKLQYIKAKDMPEFITSLDTINPVLDSEYYESIKKFNKLIPKIDVQGYLNFTNQLGMRLVALFKRMKSIESTPDQLKGDYNLQDADKFYFNLKQLPYSLKNYSAEYDIRQISKFIIALKQVVEVNRNNIVDLLESKTLKTLSRLKIQANTLDQTSMPTIVVDFIDKLNQSSLLDHLDTLLEIDATIFTLQGLAPEINYLSTVLGAVMIKNGSNYTEDEFELHQLNLRNLIYNFNFKELKNDIKVILSQIDSDIIRMQPQAAYPLKPFDLNKFGFDQDFIKILRILIELSANFHEGVDKINNLSTESAIAPLLYIALNGFVTYLNSKFEEIAKISEAIKSGNDINKAADIKRLNKILQDPDLLGVVHEVRTKLSLLGLSLHTKEFETDIMIADNLFAILHEVMDNIDLLSKEFPIDLPNLQTLPNNIAMLESIEAIMGKFKVLIEKIKPIGEQYNEIVSKNADVNLYLKTTYNQYVGLNLVTRCDYVDLDSIMKVYAVSKSITLPELTNVTLADISFTIDELRDLQNQYNSYLLNEYTTVLNAAATVNVKLPKFESITLSNLAIINAEIDDDDVRSLINEFIQKFTFGKSLKNLKTFDTSTLNVYELNVLLNAYQHITNETEIMTDVEFKQCAYIGEEFKPEFQQIVNTIPIDKKYSFDLSLLYLSTLSYLEMDNIPYYQKYCEYYEQHAQYGLDILYVIQSKVGVIEHILDSLKQSPHIKLKMNTVKFNFDDDDLTAYKLYCNSILNLETQYNDVKTQIYYLKKYDEEILTELSKIEKLAKSMNTKNKDTFDADTHFIELYNQTDSDQNTTPATIYHQIKVFNEKLKVIATWIIDQDYIPTNDESKLETTADDGRRYICYNDYYKRVDEDGTTYKCSCTESDDVSCELREGYYTKIQNKIDDNSAKKIYFDYELILNRNSTLQNLAVNIQNQMSLVYAKSAFRMRSLLDGYTSDSKQGKILTKITPITKSEHSTYSNMKSTKGVNPLEPQKYKLDPLLTYPDQTETNDYFKLNTSSFNRAVKFSKDYATYTTDYLVTTHDNKIIRLLKIFKIKYRVLGVYDAELAGYGYIEDDQVKFISKLPKDIKLYDPKLTIGDLTVGHNNISYLNQSHGFFYDNDLYVPAIYGTRTLLGFANEKGDFLIRNGDNLNEFDPTKFIKIPHNKMVRFDKFKNQKYEYFDGVNNECQNSFIYDCRLVNDSAIRLIFKSGMYKVQEHVAETPIVGMNGMHIDRSNSFTVKLATGKVITAYRIASPLYLTTDYFLIYFESRFNKWILISPQMLHPTDPIRQKIFELSMGDYSIFDSSSDRIKSLLDINYNPTPSIVNVNYKSNLYTLNDTMYFAGKKYNKVIDLTLNYVGFTDGATVIFDQKIKTTKDLQIYRDQVEFIYITSTNIH